MTNIEIAAVKETAKDYEDWLAIRRRGIGGSDAGAVLGVNPYATPLSVYLTKKGKSTFKGNAATRTGQLLEDPIRRCVETELGVEIAKPEVTYIHPRYSFMLANLDGLMDTGKGITLNGCILQGVGGWECKTSQEGAGFTETTVPPQYYAQVQHYMAVTGLKWFVLTALLMNEGKERHYVITRDEDYIAKIVDAEEAFYKEHIQADVAPAPTGNEYEAAMVNALGLSEQGAPSEQLQLPPEREADLAKLEEIKSTIKDLEAQKNAIEEQLKLDMDALGEGAKKTTARCGEWTVTWNAQERKTADSDALKKAGLFDKYCKVSTSKVLRITHKK